MNKFLHKALFAPLALVLMLLIWTHPANSEATGNTNAQTGAIETFTIDGREAEELFVETSQGKFRFTAEIADEDEERARGLMYREKMAPTHGMLFKFEELQIVLMWMKNTVLPLDMIFLNEEGEVVSVAKNTTPYSTDVISSKVHASHVLEVNAGVSTLIGLKPGDHVKHRMFESSQ